MFKWIRKNFSGVIIGIIIGLSVNIIWDWWHKINPNKIVGCFAYANDYFYADGRTYKDATASPESNMPRPIDPNDPLPLRFGAKDYKLTLGVANHNSKQLQNVILFLRLPEGVKVTKYNYWAKNSESEYYTSLGTINQDMLMRDKEPIYIAIEKPGIYILTYEISGNFPKIIRELPIRVYEK